MTQNRRGWEYALVGHLTFARARGRFGTTGSDRLKLRVHVPPRDWVGSGSTSVGDRAPGVTVPPSKRGRRPGDPGPGGPARESRARQDDKAGSPTVWSVGEAPARARGGRPWSRGVRRGQEGIHCPREAETGACQGGCVARVCHKGREEGCGVRCPSWKGVARTPRAEQAKEGATPREAMGCPFQCTGARKGGAHGGAWDRDGAAA